MDHEIVYKAQILPPAHAPFNTVTTFLICRNTLLRTGISHILSGTRFVLADEAAKDVSDLAAGADAPSLVLLCESLSQDDFLETLKRLKSQCPSARLVALTDNVEPQMVVQLCQHGLNGICPTAMPRPALLSALELVILGETFLPASLSLELLKQKPYTQPWSGPSASAIDVSGASGKLSARQTQILGCLTQGASNKLIARQLGVTEATIKVHVKALLRKVKAANRTQAAVWAKEHFTFAQCAG